MPNGDSGLCWDRAGGCAIVADGGAATAERGPALAPAGLLGGWPSPRRAGGAGHGRVAGRGWGEGRRPVSDLHVSECVWRGAQLTLLIQAPPPRANVLTLSVNLK